MSTKSIRETTNTQRPLKFIVIALAIYAGWVAATYFFEGRADLFQRVDPVGRIAYAAIRNLEKWKT